MNFGRELQDFISGFDAGWGMANKREEREWEREKRQMAREDHTYRRERDTIGDNQWERNFDQSERKFGESVRQFDENAWRTDRQYDSNEHQRGISNVHRERQLDQGQQVIDDRRIDNYTGGGLLPEDGRAVTGYDTWLEGSAGGNSGSMGRGDIESYVHRGLLERGLPEHVANGFMLNFRDESGFNPGINERNPIVAGSRGGYGLYQLTGPRRVAYEQFAQQRGVPASDVDAQLDWLMHELQGPERAAAQSIMSSQNTGTAAAAIVNNFLRPSEEHAQRRTNNYLTAYMARGGVVPDPDDEDEMLTAQPRLAPPVQQAQTAIPESSMPAPRYAQANGQSTQHIVDPYERGVQAALDGLRRAQEMSNIHQQDVLDTPEVQQAREAYLRGYGAAPQQMIRQAQDRIDPDGTMTPSERNLRAIGSAWQYFIDMGEYEKAQTVAASMVQALRQEEQLYASIAAAAAEEGDMDTAIQAAVTAYANVPNGFELDIQPNEDGTYSVAIVDQRSEQPLSQETMSPREIAAMAMNRDIGGFDEWLLTAAGMPAMEFEAPSLSDNRSTEGGTAEEVELQLGETNLSQSELGAIQDVATGISGIAQNQMSPGAAVRFVTGLFAFDANDLSNQEPNFQVQDIPRNTTHKMVISNGQQVIVPNNQVAVLQQAREQMAGGRQADFDARRESAEYWQGVVDRGVNAAQQFGSLLTGPNGPVTFDDGNAARTEEQIRSLEAGEQGTYIPALPEGSEPSDEIAQLLSVRQQLLDNPQLRETNPQQYDTLLQRTEDQLRNLGHEVGQQSNPPR